MPTTDARNPSEAGRPAAAGRGAAGDPRWRGLYRAAGAAALVIVALIPIQMFVFITWPPPTTALGFFGLFERDWLLGLLSLDLIYLVSNTLLVLVYLGLYASLRLAGESAMAIALAFGLIGIAAYFSSNTSFEMLALANQHAAATADDQRSLFLAAGEAMLATYKGTAFDVYYVLNGIALLVLSAVMLRSRDFSRATAWVGLLAGALMAVPSTAGTIGLGFAIASLVPWAVFSVMAARRLFQLARRGEQ